MKTYVTVILDQSGSMGPTKAQAVAGYNEQVQQMKMNAKDQEIFCSLLTFNGDVFEHLWCEPAEKLTEATAEDYKTEGSTAMRDAIGYAIEKMQRTTDPSGDVAYLLIVISDGEENSSKHYNTAALRELKDAADATGKWTFTYMLGCDDKYLHKVAKEMNVPLENIAKWSNKSARAAIRGMSQHVNKTQGYYDNRKKGMLKQSKVYATCGLADFTGEAADGGSIVIPPPVDPATLNVNVLHDGHTNIVANCDGSTPFKNYTPVSWKV